MKTTASYADDPSSNGGPMNPSSYAQDSSWPSTSPYSQSPYDNSPLNDGTSFSNYMHHGMPSDQLATMPSSLSHEQASQMMPVATSITHQQLPMLNTAWPSQLVQHTTTDSYAPHTSGLSAVSEQAYLEPLRTPAEKPRRTLTFEQKKEMCLYHQQNSKLRQADIGARFGVERSTVSKVLRNKDMFLKGEADKDVNGKRGNSKHPDFDRTLAVYVRKQRERGFNMSDADIMEQARMYARGSANRDIILNSLTPVWLRKFKQKHSLGTSEPLRRASEPNIQDNTICPTRFHSISPCSASAHTSPLSGYRSDEELGARGGYVFNYKPLKSQTQSETSSTDNATSSFSSDIISPVGGPFSFSPDSHQATYPLDAGFGREQKENVEFSTMELNYASQGPRDGVLMTPRNMPQCRQESPTSVVMTAPPPPPPPRVERCQEGGGGGANANNFDRKAAAIKSQVPPSPQEAQRAAATLLHYLQTTGHFGQFENEYSTIMQLTKKLQIQSQQEARSLLGGLTRIPEGDLEGITAGGDDKS